MQMQHVVLVLLAFLVTMSTQAQEATGSSEASEQTMASESNLEERASDDQALLEEVTPVEATGDDMDPREKPDTDYLSVGGFVRGIVMPQFIQNIGVEGGSTVFNFAGGAYFNYRRNGFNIGTELWYAGFHNGNADPVSCANEAVPSAACLGSGAVYRGKGQPDFENEWIESRLGAMFVSGYLAWSFELTSWAAFELGVGLGVGVTTGNMYRTEAHQDGKGGWAPCKAPGVRADGTPDGSGYCEGPIEVLSGPSKVQGGAYQRTTGATPFLFGDNGAPPILLWLDLPRASLRIKPIKSLQFKVDAGFNVYAFSFGLSGGYVF